MASVGLIKGKGASHAGVGAKGGGIESAVAIGDFHLQASIGATGVGAGSIILESSVKIERVFDPVLKTGKGPIEGELSALSVFHP